MVSENKRNSSFDYWITLSTLTPHKTIKIPIKSNNYFNNKKGELKKFIQINEIDGKKDFQFKFIKENEENNYKADDIVISIDLGLRNFFATNYGDLIGRDLIDYLRHYDKIINELDSYNRKHKLNIKSKKHNLLINKIRNHLKHVIRLSINKIIDIYKPKELKFENLNFMDTDLSPQMNRILRNFGLGYLKNILRDIEKSKGIKISYVNPAYSSQVCNNCGYVSKNNRKSQDKFVCGNCNKRCNADVNGARNLLVRSSDQINLYKSKTIVLQEIVINFLERNSSYYASCSKAKEFLLKNKYFSLEITKGFL